MASLKIAIAGGGVGGLAAAAALLRQGHQVTVCEQARGWGRVGADVNLTPNAVRALDGLGLGAQLRETAARPEYRISRTWDSGAETSRLEMSAAAERNYGAPQLTIHRADLLAALRRGVGDGNIRLGCKAVGAGAAAKGAVLMLEDGSSVEADLVIGADGIHSPVRHALFGADDPRFTGLISWRAVVPRAAVAGLPNLDSFTKWWGPTPDRQIVTFPLSRGEEIFVFATTAQGDWTDEGWTLPGDIGDLRDAFADFHPEARALLAACPQVTRSALHIREPMAEWARGAVCLLGDAAHPMVPFMAQGACMAIEDAVVLSRAVEGADTAGIPAALRRYQATRIPRTSRVQEGSLANEWLKEGGNADWVYGYDAWSVPVGDPAPAE
ncbi:FAD-dependent monooxygenase [Paracoccus sp. (in: a-proteobacteria)]|uniref:FAD-dependent monooxygenase n=1 Tax=Paracoccus sp. TaxID=267 RepID=UPI003A8A9CE5